MIDVGAVLDKYELLARVGQGGMAVVYRGLDRSLKREVAVKVLHRHLADHDEARDRFEREAHAVAKLRHENILEIFAYSGKDSPESYIVTEFIDGATLKQHITEHPPRFAEIGAMVVAEIGRALAHAHGHGILHRDVKPENVMIRSDGVVKLTDFGISQMLDAQRMTVTGQLLGSPAYMSPEHVLGNQLDFRTDVFAAGIVLYQLTVGKLPFEGKNPHEILKRIAECKFPDPRQANPRVGAELGKIILRAMAAEPSTRYPTMAAMVADLEAYLSGSGLGPAKDELARYFAAPAAYELALGSRLTDHLLRRAKDELPRRRAVALELLDRVLQIDPKHEAALALVASSARRARGRQVAAAAALLAVAGGAGWALRRATRTPASTPAIDAAVDAPAPIDGAIDTQPAVDAAAPDAAPPAIDAAPPVDAAALAIDRRPDRPDPPRVDAGPTAAATFVLTVSPPDAEVRIGDGPWQRLAGGHAELPVPPTEVAIEARRDDCCESRKRMIGPEQAGARVALALPFLPAQLTPRCARPGVGVEIDGVAARLDKPTSITFDGALSQRQVTVSFIGESIDTQKVTVRYAEQREVTCAPR